MQTIQYKGKQYEVRTSDEKGFSCYDCDLYLECQNINVGLDLYGQIISNTPCSNVITNDKQYLKEAKK